MTSDSEDKAKIKQIKEKYRSPEYRPLKLKEDSVKRQGDISIIVLCVLGIIMACVWSYLTIYYEEKEDFMGGVVGGSFWLFVILFFFLKEKIRKNDDFYFFEGKRRSSFFASSIPPEERVLKSGIVTILETMGKWLFVAAFFSFLYSFLYDPDYTLPYVTFGALFFCCSSLILLLVPPLALSLPDKEVNKLKNKHLRARKDVSNHKKRWEKAREHEEHNRFSDAERIWSDLGEKEEIKRLTRLRVEYSQIMLKRRMHDLTVKGIDTTELEKALRKTGDDIEK